MSEANIVVGLGFGDEGKGISTDYLCSFHSPKDTIVVRYNGGQQAGHHVVLDGKNHVHSNFGSGTLRGFPSYISKYCSIYPITIANEYEILQSKGITPKLIIDPLAIVTTPMDVVYNHFIEKKNNHGSCGLGIGTTMKRHNETEYKLFAADLTNRAVLSLKLANILRYYIKILEQNKNFTVDDALEYSKTCSHIMDEYLIAVGKLFLTGIIEVRKVNLSKYNVVFEGAQGIMLDKDHGFFPNVTYSDSTSKNAIALCNEFDLQYSLYYITRCYQTRHGNGPIPNYKEIQLINTDHEINKNNQWQKEFRVCEIDYSLLNMSLKIDSAYAHSNKMISQNLIITCNDQRSDFEFDLSQFGNEFDNIYKSYSPEAKSINVLGDVVY